MNNPVLSYTIIPINKLSYAFKRVSRENCDILNILENNGLNIKHIEWLPMDYGSNIVRLELRTTQNVKLIAKIGYQNRDVNKDSLLSESIIYYYLDLFDQPFIVEYVKFFTCNDKKSLSQFSLTTKDRRYLGPNIQAELDNMVKNSESLTNGFNVLLTKTGNDCTTLRSVLYTFPLTEKDHTSILLQCMFALTYFEDIGIQHNDLVLDNILIDKTPVNFSLKFRGKTFDFFSKYQVKIYNFELANMVPTTFNGGNFYLNPTISTDMQKNRCMSNQSNHGKRDTAQFLLNYSSTGSSSKFLQRLVDLCLTPQIKAVRRKLSKGQPCNQENTSEIYPIIGSAKTIMNSVTVQPNNLELAPLKTGLNVISPTLPHTYMR